MRSIRYWMNRAGQRGYTGPTEGAVLLKDGSVVRVPDFKDWSGSNTILSSIRVDDVVGVLINALKGGWGGEAQVKGLRGPFTVYARGDGTFDAALADLVSKVTEAALTYLDQTATPEAELEARLKTHDWTSWASDDHAYWSSGEADMRRITELKAQVPPATADALFAKYTPQVSP